MSFLVAPDNVGSTEQEDAYSTCHCKQMAACKLGLQRQRLTTNQRNQKSRTQGKTHAEHAIQKSPIPGNSGVGFQLYRKLWLLSPQPAAHDEKRKPERGVKPEHSDKNVEFGSSAPDSADSVIHREECNKSEYGSGAFHEEW